MITDSELQIIELEERLQQAMLQSNVAELDTLIAPELIFTNHFGQLVTKAEDLESHRSATLKFTALTPSDRQIQCHETFAIVSVLMHLQGTYNDAEFDQTIRFTRVWATSSMGSLQIVAGHTSVAM
jgi:Domain of unknown function (DUF4440)